MHTSLADIHYRPTLPARLKGYIAGQIRNGCSVVSFLNYEFSSRSQQNGECCLSQFTAQFHECTDPKSRSRKAFSHLGRKRRNDTTSLRCSQSYQSAAADLPYECLIQHSMLIYRCYRTSSKHAAIYVVHLLHVSCRNTGDV
jgi:hypothetical protein